MSCYIETGDYPQDFVKKLILPSVTEAMKKIYVECLKEEKSQWQWFKGKFFYTF